MFYQPQVEAVDRADESEQPSSSDYLRCCEKLSLILAMVLFASCAVLLFLYIGQTLLLKSPSLASDKPDDINNAYASSVLELQLQQFRAGQRTAVLRSLGMLAGMGLMFLGLSMFLMTIRTEASFKDLTLARVVARMLPAIIAIICGAMVIGVTAPEPAGENGSDYSSQTAPLIYPSAR